MPEPRAAGSNRSSPSRSAISAAPAAAGAHNVPFCTRLRPVSQRPPKPPYRRIPCAMSDQDRRHSVTDAALRRGARSPDPGAVRLAGHMGGRGQRRQALQSIRPDGVTLEGPAPRDRPRSRRLIDGQVNRDASPHAESPGSSLRRRPQLAARCRRGVLGVGARAGPARTAPGAVPAVLAEQDRPGPRGVRWF
jgi:hypothetical protein